METVGGGAFASAASAAGAGHEVDEQAASGQDERRKSFGHLLKPIRELVDNWEINITQDVSERGEDGARARAVWKTLTNAWCSSRTT